MMAIQNYLLTAPATPRTQEQSTKFWYGVSVWPISQLYKGATAKPRVSESQYILVSAALMSLGLPQVTEIIMPVCTNRRLAKVQ